MSSILKALKKLEEEKSARNPDSLKIDSEILRSDSRSRISPVALFSGAILVFIGGVGAMYLYMNKSATSPVVAISAPVPASQKNTVIVPSTHADKIKKNDPISEPKHPASKPPERSSSPVAVTRPKQSPVQPAVREISPASRKKENLKVTSPDDKKISSPSPAIKHSAIKVNGIAFQDGGSDSVAIVNGVSVSVGSVVEGAKVEEIQKDRVRFSSNGEKFEIPLKPSK